MLYFRLTVFIPLNGLAVNQMFEKHVVQFIATTDWFFTGVFTKISVIHLT